MASALWPAATWTRPSATTAPSLSLRFLPMADLQVATASLDAPALYCCRQTLTSASPFGSLAAAASAAKDPNGDALVKVCLQQYSAGASKDAVATCKSAMGKNLKDKDGAVVALGLVQVAAGQSADAIKTLNANKGDGNGPMIAHLYALYAAHP